MPILTPDCIQILYFKPVWHTHITAEEPEQIPKHKVKSSVLMLAFNSSTWRQRQEDHEIKASMMNLSHKLKQKPDNQAHADIQEVHHRQACLFFVVADCHLPIIRRAVHGASILSVQLQILWNHCSVIAEIVRG